MALNQSLYIVELAELEWTSKRRGEFRDIYGILCILLYKT